MIKNIKKWTKLASMFILGSLFLYQCEPDADSLGEQFFLGDAAQAKESFYPIIANNLNNNDSIRSDASRLRFAQIGAFTENVFGMQKASYATQLRMSSYNPDFGGNAVIDSVVLVMNPVLVSDSVETSTDENYIYPNGNVAAKKETKTYPVSRYGKITLSGTDPSLTLQVHEVTDFLESNTKTYYSDQQINTSNVLGQKGFSGKVTSTTITSDADASTLWSNDANIRIPLDSDFFQTKIIAKQGSTDLKDAANFIRYFRGIKVSVLENDGFLFPISTLDAQIIMYYKYDKDDNGTVTRPQKTFAFTLGANNVHIGLYDYDRTGTPLLSALSNPNLELGDSQLFVQGMGGPSVKVKIPESTIEELKNKYINEKIGIITAKIRFYTDTSIWNNSYEKPKIFTITNNDRTEFTTDLTTLVQAPGFTYFNPYNLDQNPSYYEFTITQSLKDIVEKNILDTDSSKDEFLIDVGEFLLNSANTGLLGSNRTSRPYDPHRVVLVGSNPISENKAQLRVVYGTK